jgi:RHS repeat-associated protein
MVYSEVSKAGERKEISRYGYDGYGRRTIVQGAGVETMRTLYDGLGFEEIRSGVTFADGSFTTRYATGIVRPVEQRDEGMRYRWLGINTDNGGIDEESGASAVRYTGIQAVLYGRGEAVGMNRTSSEGSRGGSVYLGKDVLGSVRSTTGEYGTLEERYEYDAFGKPYKGDLENGMNLGYTGKPYDAATGLYNYGYRDYKPEVARFTTVDPVRDGSNWFAYVNNDPVNYIDPWGLDSMYSTYIQGSGKIVSTYIPTNPDGTRDYASIKTYSFSASNEVKNEVNGQRKSPNVTTSPANREPKEYYYPRNFPTGTFDVKESIPISENHEKANELGRVFIPTTATQEVPTYGKTEPKPDENGRYNPTGSQPDGGYGYHYNPSYPSTLGCLRAGSQEDAFRFAELSDRALASGGTSTISSLKGK